MKELADATFNDRDDLSAMFEVARKVGGPSRTEKRHLES